jgi:hypothetical protein
MDLCCIKSFYSRADIPATANFKLKHSTQVFIFPSPNYCTLFQFQGEKYHLSVPYYAIPCKLGMAHSQVEDGGNGPQIWRGSFEHT